MVLPSSLEADGACKLPWPHLYSSIWVLLVPRHLRFCCSSPSCRGGEGQVRGRATRGVGGLQEMCPWPWTWVPFPVLFFPLLPMVLVGGPGGEVGIGLEIRSVSHTRSHPSGWRQNQEKKNQEAGIVLVKAAPRQQLPARVQMRGHGEGAALPRQNAAARTGATEAEQAGAGVSRSPQPL